MQFEHPNLLWSLLAIVPALIAFFWWAARKKLQLITQFISARLLSSLTVGVSAGRQNVRVMLIVTAVSLIIIALARPQIGFSWEEARSRGLDIVVAIDTSRSMLATDVRPNRLQRAKLEALNLKRLAKTDRLALVAFAGSAFLQSPLTLDDEAFRQSVELLDVNIIPQGGTALSEAIAAAKSAFKEGNDNHKVLVLMTDGEDHDGSALETAKQAAKDGLRLFTIGVGTPNGEMLRTTDVQGRTEFIKDADGNAVKSRLDETLLKDLAKETGGFYLPLSGATTMSLLYERGLAPLPKSELASQKIKRFNERYQWLLGLALVLLLAEMLVPGRTKTVATAGTTSAGPDAATTKAIALAMLLMLPASLCASSDEAMKEYREGNFVGAQAAYEVRLMKKPGDARLRFNAGAAALQGGDYNAALQHLNAALTNAPVDLQQRAYYNIGSAFFRLGESAEELERKQSLWQTAVTNFNHAVALRTNDADARFNLDFARSKVAEIQRLLQLREDARRAKLMADAAARRRDYHGAREIMETKLNEIKQATTNALAQEFEAYTGRLKDIDEIATPARR